MLDTVAIDLPCIYDTTHCPVVVKTTGWLCIADVLDWIQYCMCRARFRVVAGITLPGTCVAVTFVR
jgi:hypothetical protein